ncbi:hypothetical protein SDC9_166620 [bioreactor metagenome]|uniref:Uncharacterized protein n=1 Tax=bioreactor metagenome TaxID=1076179 RepID=A0A645G5G9_9ZZZZ
MGLGDWLDAPFGDYLKADTTLNKEIRELMVQEFVKLNDKPIGYTHQVSEIADVSLLLSGYTTGYSLLHGTERTVGGFAYQGTIIKRGPRCYDGDMTFIWNDKIDPNHIYILDSIFSAGAKMAFAFMPKDYIIRIKFNGTFQAEITADSNGYFHFTGYPRDNPMIDMVD